MFFLKAAMNWLLQGRSWWRRGRMRGSTAIARALSSMQGIRRVSTREQSCVIAGFVFTSISQSPKSSSIMKSIPNSSKQKLSASSPGRSEGLRTPFSRLSQLDSITSTQQLVICALMDCQTPLLPTFLFLCSSSMNFAKVASASLLPSSKRPQSVEWAWTASLVRCTRRLGESMSKGLLEVRTQHSSQQYIRSWPFRKVTSIQLRISNLRPPYSSGRMQRCRITLLRLRRCNRLSRYSASSPNRRLSSSAASALLCAIVMPLPRLEFSPGLMIQCCLSACPCWRVAKTGWLRSLSSQVCGTSWKTSLSCACRWRVRCRSRFFLSLMQALAGKWLWMSTLCVIGTYFSLFMSARRILPTSYASHAAISLCTSPLQLLPSVPLPASMFLLGENSLARLLSQRRSLEISLVLRKFSAFTIIFSFSSSASDFSRLCRRFLRTPLRQNCVQMRLATAESSTTRQPLRFLTKLLSSSALLPSSTKTLKQLILGEIWMSTWWSRQSAWLRCARVMRSLLVGFTSCRKESFSTLSRLPRLTRNDFCVLLQRVVPCLGRLSSLTSSPLSRSSDLACYSGRSSWRVSWQRISRLSLAFRYRLRELRLSMVKWFRMGLRSLRSRGRTWRPRGPSITPWMWQSGSGELDLSSKLEFWKMFLSSWQRDGWIFPKYS